MIWGVMLEGLRGVWLRLVAFAAAGVAILVLLAKVKQAGRRELEHEQLEFAFEQAQKRKEAERISRTLPRSELDRRLQSDYRD